MSKISTILFIYNNFPGSESQLIFGNDDFDDEFNEFSEVFEILDDINFEPSNETVNRIVDFAKSF